MLLNFGDKRTALIAFNFDALINRRQNPAGNRTSTTEPWTAVSRPKACT